MQAMASMAPPKSQIQRQVPSTNSALTLMDLFTALCEETEDDTLVAAAVCDLFQKGIVRFTN